MDDLGAARELVGKLEAKRHESERELDRLTRAKEPHALPAAAGDRREAKHLDQLNQRIAQQRVALEDIDLALGQARANVARIEAEQARAADIRKAAEIEAKRAELHEQDKTVDMLADSLGRALSHRAMLIGELAGMDRELRDVQRHVLAQAVARGLAGPLQSHLVIQHSWPPHHLGRLAECPYPEVDDVIARLRGAGDKAA
jgi:hypothetical protein